MPSELELEEELESPCVSVCQLGADGVCLGCGRTLAEIGEWTMASSERQREIVQLARARRAAVQGAGKGTT